MSRSKNLMNTFLVAVFTALLLPGLANAGDRILIDAGDSNLAFAPAYARVINNGLSDFVPIVFYRNPICVDPDFDLISFIDLPTPNPMPPPPFLDFGAFGCLPLTVEGFAIFEGEFDPFAAIPPIQNKLTGDAVPFVFVARDDFDAVAADGLTMADLYDVGLWGTATSFKEVLHPLPGVVQVGLINIVATGALDDDGTPFKFRLTSQFFYADDGIQVLIAERVFNLKFD